MYETIALKLQVTPQELEQASLHLFLSHQARLLESQLLRLAHKYGVYTVTELDQLVQNGALHESEAFEDYFEFDYLEAQLDMLRESLQELS